MSDTMEVRDHSQRCEHGEDRGHYWKLDWCDGGKRIVLRKTKHSKTDATPDLWTIEVSDDE